LNGLEVWIDPISEEEVGFFVFSIRGGFPRGKDVRLGPELPNVKNMQDGSNPEQKGDQGR
jgi:hypothetical protein